MVYIGYITYLHITKSNFTCSHPYQSYHVRRSYRLAQYLLSMDKCSSTRSSPRSKQEIKAIQFAIANSFHTPCRSCPPMTQIRTNTSPHSLLRGVKAKKKKKVGRTNTDILARKTGLMNAKTLVPGTEGARMHGKGVELDLFHVPSRLLVVA